MSFLIDANVFLRLVPKAALAASFRAFPRLRVADHDLLQDFRTVLVTPDRNSLHVDAGRRLMPVTERFLDIAQAAFQISQYSCVGMSQLVEVNILDAGLARVTFQVLDERVGGERGARPPGSVVTSPERSIIFQNAQPPARS